MDNMGDLSELLGPILSDPETMDKLRQEAEKLGLGDLIGESFSSQERGGSGNYSPEASQGSSNGASTNDPLSGGMPSDIGDIGNMSAMLTRLVPLFSGMSREDDSTRLLHALRPFLSEKRGKRLDEAGKMLMIMRVIKMLPDLNSKT